MSVFQQCKKLGFQAAACCSIGGNNTYLTEMSEWCLKPEDFNGHYIFSCKFKQNKPPPSGRA